MDDDGRARPEVHADDARAPRVITFVVPEWLGIVAALLAAFGVVVGGGIGWAVARAPQGVAADAAGVALPEVSIWRAPVVPTPAPSTNPLAEELPRRPNGSADGWPHDVFAAVRDPNVLQAGFAPARLEDADAQAPEAGPRLAVGGFDVGLTRDLGTLAAERPTTTTLALGNVGDAPLSIGRIYFGSSAVGLAAAGEPPAIDATGRFAAPLVLAPGAVRDLVLDIDPRRLTATGTQAVYLQLFTNDPRLEPFADGDPDDREGRVRLVLAVRPTALLDRPIGPGEVPLVPGAPRAWLPELARDGRGGDLVRLDVPSPGEPMARDLVVRNLGDVPLTLAVDPASLAVEASLAAAVVPPGGSTTLSIRLEPMPGLDDGPHVRRTLRLTTDDSLAPEIAIDLVGRWDAPAPGAPDDDPNRTSERPRGPGDR